MNTTELAFFALALALPLVGGSALLYFISKVSKKSDKETEKDDAR